MKNKGFLASVPLEMRWLWALGALLIAGLSCLSNPLQPAPDQSLVDTQIALSIQQTLMALEADQDLNATSQATGATLTIQPSQTIPAVTQPPAASEPASTAPPEFTFTLRRQAQAVLMGPSRPLSPVTSDDPQPFPEGFFLSTDQVGEALLEGDLEGKICRLFVFFNTSLQKKACPESTFSGSNASCLEEGSAVYRECSNHLVTTGSGEFQMLGTWASVTYFPDQRASIFIVLQGEAIVRSIANIDTHEFAPEEVVLTSGQFLYTAPDGWLEPIPGLEPRQPHSLERLPALLPAFDILPYFEKIGGLARGEDLYFPPPDLLTGPPDLVIHLEAAELTKEEQANAKPLTDYVFVGVYAIINNQGGQPADIFRVSVDGTASDGTFDRLFFVQGQEPWMWIFTTEPLPPGGQVVFRGVVGFPSSLAGQNATITAIVDSCVGEETFVAGCRVSEQNEDNNLSNPLDVILSKSYSQ